MQVSNALDQIQLEQQEYNQKYNKDVLALPFEEGVARMMFRFGKNCGLIAKSDDPLDREVLSGAFTDALINCLAGANMCKFLLSDKIPFADDERKRAFEELGKIHTNCAEYNSDEPVWQNRSMVISCGRLAEICESWDQMNAYSRRKGIIRIIVAISCAALVAAYKLEFNIHMYVKFRHDKAKLETIYHRHIYQPCPAHV